MTKPKKLSQIRILASLLYLKRDFLGFLSFSKFWLILKLLALDLTKNSSRSKVWPVTLTFKILALTDFVDPNEQFVDCAWMCYQNKQKSTHPIRYVARLKGRPVLSQISLICLSCRLWETSQILSLANLSLSNAGIFPEKKEKPIVS